MRLQAIEDALPYEPHKRVREDISVGVYDVIADFGQARGTNTATILPNDPLFARRYGRTILMRRNILENPDLFAGDLRVWRAAMEETHAEDLVSEGNFQRTLWHEVGHYLGVDRDKQGRTLDAALEDYADAFEEMKADLVSLFALDAMRTAGTVTPAMLRAVQAAGIRRVLLNVKPRRDQPYQTMQLAQFNYFLEKGLLAFDGASGRLAVHYERYAGRGHVAAARGALDPARGRQVRRRTVLRSLGRVDAANCTSGSPLGSARRRDRASGSCAMRRWASRATRTGTATPLPQAGWRLCRIPRPRGDRRQEHTKRGPLTWALARRLHPPAVCFDDAAHDRQAESESGGSAVAAALALPERDRRRTAGSRARCRVPCRAP